MTRATFSLATTLMKPSLGRLAAQAKEGLTDASSRLWTAIAAFRLPAAAEACPLGSHGIARDALDSVPMAVEGFPDFATEGSFKL